MIDWLKHEWKVLASKYTEDATLISNYWDEIVQHYTSKSRYYHNLSHIYNMLLQAKDIQNAIEDYDAFRFSIWYHDIIYKSTKKNNEEKSAKFAQKRLKVFNFDEKRIKIIETVIKSTQKHDIVLNQNQDNAYLLDIDLSILGTEWTIYETYIQNIRKEYGIYPDFMYKKGRKKAMQHFLERKYIYFTDAYQNKFEVQARQNIEKEINLL
jgi:predicted metal-dependent HD superfamily phosphohydrolase